MVNQPASVTSPDQNASEKEAESSANLRALGCAAVGHGAWLDPRHALLHPQAGWMAIADLHYGYESTRRRQGALIPEWGRDRLQSQLHGLLADHQPQRLILVGDIMDSAASAQETLDFLHHLRLHVPQLICLIGNHDRPSLRRPFDFLPHHQEDSFLFHHGHQQPPPSDTAQIEVIGHHHPAHSFRDGAGLRLKLPCLIQDSLPSDEPSLPPRERWVLPAFSPWAAGGAYSGSSALRTWLCAQGRVWPLR